MVVYLCINVLIYRYIYFFMLLNTYLFALIRFYIFIYLRIKTFACKNHAVWNRVETAMRKREVRQKKEIFLRLISNSKPVSLSLILKTNNGKQAAKTARDSSDTATNREGRGAGFTNVGDKMGTFSTVIRNQL